MDKRGRASRVRREIGQLAGEWNQLQKRMRRKRWIRGGTQAADAHEILVVYGRTGERLGKVGEKYGPKRVLLLNVTPERERAVGFVLAPLRQSERALLKIILRGLQERFGPVGEGIKTLVLDRGYCGQRWGIENQGFRELTQEWALDCLAGRRFNTLNSRIAFALMRYNAERLLRMKHPGPWREERERLRGLGERNRLSGPSRVAYTPQGQRGFLRPPEHERLIVERERDRLVHTRREGLAHADTLERMLQRLQNPSAS